MFSSLQQLILLVLVYYSNCEFQTQPECDNNPYFENRGTVPIHNITIPQLINVTDHSLQLFNFYKKDSSLYYIKGQKERQEFIICLPPKSGSTRIKMILNRIMDSNYRGSLTHEYQRYDRFNPLEYQDASTLQRILNDKNIPRFILTRNPYIRIISMYQDKILRKSMKMMQYRKNIGFQPDQKVTFNAFVELLYERPRSKKLRNELLNQHFVSQTKICAMDIGMSFNIILQVEKLNEWYDCFIDKVNTRDEMMYGWPDQNQCYFSSPKNPCNGPFMENGILKKTDQHTTNHNTGSFNLLDAFFNNKTLAKMVSEIFLEDIINFNYPLIQ